MTFQMTFQRYSPSAYVYGHGEVPGSTGHETGEVGLPVVIQVVLLLEIQVAGVNHSRYLICRDVVPGPYELWREATAWLGQLHLV